MFRYLQQIVHHLDYIYILTPIREFWYRMLFGLTRIDVMWNEDYSMHHMARAIVSGGFVSLLKNNLDFTYENLFLVGSKDYSL